MRMMLKWFVLACLCAFSFAGIVYNQDFGCSYHVKVEYPPPNTDASFDSYVVSYFDDPTTPRFNKIVYVNGASEILRCDERDSENKCVTHYDSGYGYCSDGYFDPSSGWVAVFSYTPEFMYDEKHYPVDVDCPDNSAGCKLYADEEGEFVVVNQEGYFVNVSGTIFTFYDPPSMDEFVFDTCNQSKHYSAPANTCGKMENFYPTKLDCPYHVSIKYDSGVTNELYGAMVDGVLVYAKVIYSSYNLFIRCDAVDENSKCYFKYDDEMCVDQFVDYGSVHEYLLELPELFEYDSVNYPKPVVCPNNSDGCQLYCDDMLEANCITVDDAGRIVKIGNKALTYFEPPSLDVFDIATCTGEPLPAPRDYCAEKDVASPKFPDCAFHIKSERAVPPKRDIQSYDLYAIRDNDGLSMITITHSSGKYIIRFDVVRRRSVFLQELSSGNCEDYYVDPFEAMSQLSSYYFPQPIRYNSSEYPVDVECPDGTQGCKKYCSVLPPFAQDCVIVDADGYFVHTEVLGNLTYDTKVPMDVFETDTCNKQTHIPAPPSNLCQSSSSSTHASSSTSSKTPASVNPSLSSASNTKAAFILVAIAVGAFIL